MLLFDKLIEKLYFKQRGNLALYDKLTGVYNYNWMSLIGADKYRGKELYIIVIDINGFKSINDTHGHLYGNKILQDVAQSLSKLKEIDPSTDVIRYGGDEFVVVSNSNLTKVIRKSDKDDLLSIGMAIKEVGENITAAFVRADCAMYIYKEDYKKKKKKKKRA